MIKMWLVAAVNKKEVNAKDWVINECDIYDIVKESCGFAFPETNER